MAKKIDYASLFTLRKDGRYVATYSNETGRHHIYDRDPEKLYKKLQAVNEKQEVPTVRDIAAMWERQHREEITPRTWNNYLPHYQEILHRHGDKTMDELTALDVANHLTYAKTQGYSRTVTNSIRSLYRMIFDYAVGNNFAKYNPVSSVKLPKGLKQGKRVAPTDEQIKAICTHVDYWLFPFFLLCTGMRKSEALALTWDDINFKELEISVTKSLDYTSGANPVLKPPKTEAGNRIVPIIEPLLPYLQQANSASKGDLLFPASPSTRGGEGGGYMTLRGYEGAWNRFCSVAGLIDTKGKPVLGAHNLRHGTATLMFELDVDVHTAQRILGHSRVEVTQGIYTELRAKQRQKSVEKFSSGMSKYLSP